MAEALCGLSNPLQNIRKHAGIDRTLQQDRLAFSQSPSQAFRSVRASGPGNIDAEFEAFQAGPNIDGGFQEYYPLPAQGPSFGLPVQQLSGWASEFQHLNLSDARSSPIPSSQFRYEAPLQRSGAGGWHQEFMRQNECQTPQLKNMEQTYNGAGWQSQSQYQPFPNFAMPVSSMSAIAQQKQPELRSDDLFDDAAFERAFDAARMELAKVELQSKSGSQETRSEAAQQYGQETADLLNVNNFDHEGFKHGQTSYQSMIGSDAILNESSRQAESHEPDREADELARTAGQLLDNLKHEQSRKFQDSTFLALMRQLRDKEVRVEGDQMVDNTQDLHPGGQHYPEGQSSGPKHAVVSDYDGEDGQEEYTN